MALSYMKNEADAEDVSQEAFIKGVSKARIISRGIQIQHVAYQYHDQRGADSPPQAGSCPDGAARSTSGRR